MVGVSVFMLAAYASAVHVMPEELAETRRWCAAKFEGVQEERPVREGLTVLANHGVVQANARAGAPLNITGTQYTRGLYCHAPSRIVVTLPGPGKTFTAIAGVDSNDQTSGGRASVVFSVEVNGEQAYRSPLMREGTPAKSVEVDLDGATEFVLAIGDGGDGISCDQGDWVDARVVLADGREVWVGDIPILQRERGPVSLELPFSFNYDGQPSSAFLSKCDLVREARAIDAQRTQRTLTYTDPGTGLEVRCDAVEYLDYPVVEWTLYFRNTGTADSPILSDIQALDARFDRGEGGEFVLHHHVGSPCRQDDYAPHATALAPNAVKRITTCGGRATDSDLPYFNIERPGGGVIAAIGWPGQWAAEFSRDAATGLRVRGGQELTHFTLHPGEEVRSPLIALQFYAGDRVRSQNVWRRWMLAHNVPRPGGEPLKPQCAAVSGNHYPGLMCNQKDEIFFIDRFLEKGIRFDYWWMDAGWYPCAPEGWPKTGTWEVDRTRFPGGIRAVTDHAHSKGIRSILWFEPERVHPGTWLYDTHPEWLLGPDGGTKLLNLGNPDALRWVTDHIDRILTDEGIDLYRQDFNMAPLDYWRANDAPGRQGITEIKHVTGYLAFWDELLRRHPGMVIDSCASGGRRNDLETLRRAIPLLRSDYLWDPIGEQGHTYGIASWMPWHGTGFIEIDPYLTRSLMSPQFTLGQDMRRDDLDYDLLRRLVDEWREVADCYLGDYYPLTPYTLANDQWMALQFDRPDLNRGVVHVFRRANSFYEAARFFLGGLDPDARYALKDMDAGDMGIKTGRDLMENGISISIQDRRGAAVIVYSRIP